ncbi:MAG TPA: hypothetical protein VLJ84_07965 [Usitatibacter sp.]|nr:hypothetical protein [Usitatibacter sp.]
MNRTPLSLAIVLAAFAAAMPASADEPVPIAKLKDLHGNVLVSKSSGLAAGGEGTRLTEGVRVITANSSDVVVQYDDGCEVRLKSNQRFLVERGKPCAVLVAQPESILATPEGAAVTTIAGAAGVTAILLPSLGVAGLAAILERRSDRKVSPS